MSTPVEVSHPREGIALVTLNVPERLNALEFSTFEVLRSALERVDDDPTCRAVVITGAGRAFCAGLHLDDAERLTSMSPHEMLRGQETWAAAIVTVARMRTPVVAAVNGAASGAGFALALAADLRIAEPSTRFNAAFIKIGLSGGDCGTSWFLPRIVGLGLAAEILLTGRFVLADEAARIGLVNSVALEGGLLDEALDLAASVVANSALAVHLTKQLLHTNVDAPSLQAALELENRSQVLATRGADMPEALLAFTEKRQPHFAYTD